MKYLILLLLITNVSFAQVLDCSALFGGFKPSEEQIQNAISEFYYLRKDVYSADVTRSAIAKKASEDKFTELLTYLTREEILERLKSTEARDVEVEKVKPTRNEGLEFGLSKIPEAEQLLREKNINLKTSIYEAGYTLNRADLIPSLYMLGAKDIKLGMDDKTTLMHFVKVGNVEAVRLITAYIKETLHEKDVTGASALSYTYYINSYIPKAREKDIVKILKILIDAGAKDHPSGKEGWTTLMNFIKRDEGDVEIIKTLASLKDTINLRDSSGETALKIAKDTYPSGHKDEIIKILTAAGAIE